MAKLYLVREKVHLTKIKRFIIIFFVILHSSNKDKPTLLHLSFIILKLRSNTKCNWSVTAWLGLFTLMQSFEGQLTHFCWSFLSDFLFAPKMFSFFPLSDATASECSRVFVRNFALKVFDVFLRLRTSVCECECVWEKKFVCVSEGECVSVGLCVYERECVYVSVSVFLADVSGCFRTRSYLVLSSRLSLHTLSTKRFHYLRKTSLIVRKYHFFFNLIFSTSCISIRSSS